MAEGRSGYSLLGRVPEGWGGSDTLGGDSLWRTAYRSVAEIAERVRDRRFVREPKATLGDAGGKPRGHEETAWLCQLWMNHEPEFEPHVTWASLPVIRLGNR